MAEAGGMKGRPSASFWWMERAVGLEGDLKKKKKAMENCPLPQERRKLCVLHSQASKVKELEVTNMGSIPSPL